jgi:hypothetical protein
MPKIKDMPGATLEERAIIGIFRSFKNGENKLFPSQEYLAKELGCSVRTIKTTVCNLEKKGLINKRRRGLGKTNLYELTIEENNRGKICTSDADRGKICPSLGAEIAPEGDPYIYINKKDIEDAESGSPNGDQSSCVSFPNAPSIPSDVASPSSASAPVFDSQTAIEKLKAPASPLHERIVGWFFDSRDLVVPDQKEFNKAFRRLLGVAGDIAKYEKSHGLDHVLAAFDEVEGTDFKWRKGLNSQMWTLEDVLKLLRSGWKG